MTEQIWDFVKNLAEQGRNGQDEPALSPPGMRAIVPPPVEAPGIAYETRILDRFRKEVRWHGVVGEDTIAATTYLVMTSRLLPKPVSEAVKGNSSSGKSHTVQTTTRFFPPEAFLEITAMSEKAIVYMKDDYRHRSLVIYEAEALREYDDSLTSYFVRSLLSEGQIKYPVTVRDKDGNFTTKTIVKEGPTNIVFTTTRARVHYENETRVLSLSTDDSQDQTRRVLFELADENDTAHDLSEWHALQRWITAGEHRVTIPYATRLAELVPPIAVRLRRDFGAVLALVRTHAILHQATRDRDQDGRIVATIDDYDVVRELIGDVISTGIGATVSDTVRETVAAVGVLATEDGLPASKLAEHLKLDKSAARRRLLVAAADDYVKNLEDKKGRPGRWVLGDPMPDAVDVLPPCHLLATTESVTPEGEDECGGTVANDPVGEKERIAVIAGILDAEIVEEYGKP
jgi:hypothetical protein